MQVFLCDSIFYGFIFPILFSPFSACKLLALWCSHYIPALAPHVGCFIHGDVGWLSFRRNTPVIAVSFFFLDYDRVLPRRDAPVLTFVIGSLGI